MHAALLSLIGAASAATALAGTLLVFTLEQGRAPGEMARTQAAMNLAAVRVAAGATLEAGLRVPPPEAPGQVLAGLTDRYGNPLRYCAARPSQAPGAGYSAPGTELFVPGQDARAVRVALIVAANDSPDAVPVQDALADLATACASLSALEQVRGPVTDPAHQLAAHRTVRFITYGELAAERAGTGAFVPDGAALAAAAGAPAAAPRGAVSFNAAQRRLELFDGTQWVAASGRVIDYPVCPTHYVGIPTTRLENGTLVPAFCIGRYLAARVRTCSNIDCPGYRPWTAGAASMFGPRALMQDGAGVQCALAGAQLPSIEQWQAVGALALGVADNWTGRAVGSGLFIAGYGSNPNSAEPAPAAPAGFDERGYSGSPVPESTLAGVLPGYPLTYVADEAQRLGVSLDQATSVLKRRHIYLRPDNSDWLYDTLWSGYIEATRSQVESTVPAPGTLSTTWNARADWLARWQGMFAPPEVLFTTGSYAGSRGMSPPTAPAPWVVGVRGLFTTVLTSSKVSLTFRCAYEPSGSPR